MKNIKGKIKLSDIINYVIGHYRYWIYYFSSNHVYLNKAIGSLMRNHIREQILYRIKVMNAECYTSGSCIKCGCMTTALQMCNKSCEGNCYPPMLSRNNWCSYRLDNILIFNKDGKSYWKMTGNNKSTYTQR